MGLRSELKRKQRESEQNKIQQELSVSYLPKPLNHHKGDVIDRKKLHTERINKKIGDKVKCGNKEGTVVKVGKGGIACSVQVQWDDGTSQIFMGREYNKVSVI